MGTRDFYADMYGVDYCRAMENYYNRTRAKCSIEVFTRDDDHDKLVIYGAYTDSIKLDGLKLTFTAILGNKETTTYLDSVTKVTINKESK